MLPLLPHGPKIFSQLDSKEKIQSGSRASMPDNKYKIKYFLKADLSRIRNRCLGKKDAKENEKWKSAISFKYVPQSPNLKINIYKLLQLFPSILLRFDENDFLNLSDYI